MGGKIMKMKKVLAILLAVAMIAVFATACMPTTTGTQTQNTPTPTQKPADTATPTKAPEATPKPVSATPLVAGYQQFSQKFSPFFATTGYDMDATSLTQVSILTTDRSGGIVYNAIKGETIKYNGVDYFYNGIADVKVTYDEKADMTTYYMKIRDDVKFSDGHVMDADDIIFSYYVLSDPSYTGSSTLYSYKIPGMINYRKNNSKAEELEVTPEELAKEMENPSAESKAAIEKFVADLLASELDWVKGLYGNASYQKYTDAHPVAKDLFAFFYAIDENYDSTTVEDEAKVLADITAQYGTDFVTLGANYGQDFTPDIETIVGDLLLQKKLETSGGTEVNNITGIKKLSQTEVEVKVKGFEAPAVYSICGIQVAPLHYYGDEKQYDYANNKFGFPKGDLSIVDAKTTKPMGAGPYKFIKFENKVIYYEANEYFYKGAPKTKYLQLKETVDNEMIAGVGTGVIDLANPSGSIAKFDEVKKNNSNGKITGDAITTSSVDNLGYGYIGISAKNVNVGGVIDSEASKNLRKGFATLFAVYRDVAIDSYYGDAAAVINYPISNTSWAAPQKADAGYEVAFSKDVDGNPIYTADMVGQAKYDAALKAAIGFFKAAGYTFDEASGKFTAAPDGAKLEYEIIIPGDGIGDHPAFAILTDTRAALEKIGITLKITDPSDSNVLWDSLDAMTQEMWTAAWGATIDPDMHQIYHSSNTADLQGTKSNHYYIKDAELDELIMTARKSADQAFRKATYKRALDIILDWAVEIPNYQRQNMVIFSTQRIKIDTVTPDITTYWGWGGGLNPGDDVHKLEMAK